MPNFFTKHSHLWWLAIGVLAAILFISLWGFFWTFVVDGILAAIIAAALYALDYRTVKKMQVGRLQLIAALVVSLVVVLAVGHGVLAGFILIVWNTIVAMMVFSASAKFWPNSEAILKRAQSVAEGKEDAWAAARDVGSAAANAGREGFARARSEATTIAGLNEPKSAA
jgi:predicted PurR-regulated permease PerM